MYVGSTDARKAETSASKSASAGSAGASSDAHDAGDAPSELPLAERATNDCVRVAHGESVDGESIYAEYRGYGGNASLTRGLRAAWRERELVGGGGGMPLLQ